MVLDKDLLAALKLMAGLMIIIMLAHRQQTDTSVQVVGLNAQRITIIVEQDLLQLMLKIIALGLSGQSLAMALDVLLFQIARQ